MRWKGEILSAESCCSYQRLSTVWGVVEEAPSPACCSLLAASLLPRLPGDSWGTPALQPLLFICQGGWKEQLEMGCSKNRNLMLAINQDVHTSLWLACGALYTSVYLVWLTEPEREHCQRVGSGATYSSSLASQQPVIFSLLSNQYLSGSQRLIWRLRESMFPNINIHWFVVKWTQRQCCIKPVQCFSFWDCSFFCFFFLLEM